MKNLTVFSTAVLALALTADAMAQTRGPRYNPGGGSSSSSSSPRGPSYNPGGSSSSSSSSRPTPSSSSSSSSSYRPSPRSTSSSSTPRGPSYNPGGSSTSSSSTRRGPSYNPSPSAPSRPSPSTSTTPRGPSYNPTPSRPAPSTTPSTPTYTPTPSTSTTPRGPRYNPTPDQTPSPTTSTPTPTTPRGPRYNPDPTSGPVVVTPSRPTPIPVPNPGSVRVPRGPRYNPPTPNTPASYRNDHVIVRRTVFTHVPYSVSSRSIVYYSPRDYYMRVNRHYIYYRWIQEPVIWTYTDGYWEIDDYPYYVDNGYRYRYSPVETCKYDLVDGNDYTVVRQFEESCNTAFDRCAVERDNLNTPIGLDRFFCAESVDDDLVVEDRSEYNPLPTVMSPQQQATIENYLRNKTLEDIFTDGRDGLGKCKIEKRFLKKCKYMVKVEGKSFPELDGSVCSATENAALAGCKEPDQKGNAGCLLEKAILRGLCLE